ncbi:class I SAM-dependent methyltransferase [Daejeonia sp. YH14]|uniref:class I SAM-dependent methyltransferase n=1 Tax=Daejeonia sp. YH14 TaxID=3439042 RepID=UPI003F4962D9
MSDLPGKAIFEYHFQKSRKKLYVHDTFGPKTEMPVSYYFRSLVKMPELEQQAIAHCTGKILDIGAAAGSHALQLVRNGREVVALDISPNSCEVMKDRGLTDVVCEDYSSPQKSDSKFNWKKPIKFTICHREENSIHSLSSRLS